MRTYFSRTVAMTLGLGLLLSVLSGCNTMAGAGTDIQRGGEHVTNAADNVKAKM